MKIRTDFVTNSSSSSYVVTLKIIDKKGKTYSVDSSYAFTDDGNCDSSFDGDLKEAKKKKTVKELCDYLLDNIDDGTWYEDEEDDEYDDEMDEENEDDEEDYDKIIKQVAEKARSEFETDVTSNIKKIKDIKEIVVYIYYSAWGECAELVADNDEKLCSLAKKYREAKEGRKKRKAKKALIKYIKTSDEDRVCESFGEGYEDFRYVFDPTDENIEELAKRIGSGYGPGAVEGATYDILNMKNGKITRYAEFILA